MMLLSKWSYKIGALAHLTEIWMRFVVVVVAVSPYLLASVVFVARFIAAFILQ